MGSKILFLIFCIILPFYAHSAYIIRDAETEDYVRKILDEILIQASIQPKTINLFLIKDDSLNAAVAGGPNIFVNTGLIQSSSNYEMVQAVLAHEVGHIKASHILNFQSTANKTLMEALFYSVSGALIALSGGVGAAVITGIAVGSNVAEKRFLSYSRMQEMEADFYAYQFLSGIKSSGYGAIQLFYELDRMQSKLIDASRLNPYYATHPFPSQRRQFFEQKFSKINYTPVKNAKLQEEHLLISAKLAGYFGNMNSNFSNAFLQNANSRLYFQGFTAFRMQNFEEAEKIFLNLLEKQENNPYIYEILAQISHKNQNYNTAINLFQKAIKIKPNEFNFIFEVSESYIAKKDYNTAIKFMENAFKLEPYNPQIPFKLAEIYSIKGEHSIAKFYFIESEVLRQNYGKAKVLLDNFKKNNNTLPQSLAAKMKDIEEFLRTK